MTELGKLYGYRKYWMGIAMLWIVFFHIDIPVGGIVGQIKELGYGGVDIFIFASGIGCYLSYMKNKSPLFFIGKRIRRLAPSYLPFIVVWIVYNLKMGLIDSNSVIGNLFGIQGFSRNRGEFNWYITCIIICYLLTPYLAQFVEEKNIMQIVVLGLCLLLMSFAFWNDLLYIISVSRIPVFFVGMVFAKYKDRKITVLFCVINAILPVLGIVCLKLSRTYMWKDLQTKGLYWYPFLLIAPSICMLISLVIDAVERHDICRNIFKPLFWLLSGMGKYSFEIFLVHIFVFDILKRNVVFDNTSEAWLIYLCAVAGSILIAVAMSTATDKIFLKKEIVG